MVAWTSDFGTHTTTDFAVPVRTQVRFGIDGLPVPRLRGKLHEGAVIPTAIVGIGVMLLTSDMAARFAVGVFTFCIVAMLTASAVYHCHCDSVESRLRARRVDHGTILVAIAGTQTAFWTLVGPPMIAIVVIAAVWLATALGFRHKIRNLHTVDSTGNWLFTLLGWSGAALIPWLYASGLVVLGLVLLGGAAYSIGGLMLFKRRGELWPGVVGYHEVWHALTIVGFVSHGAAIVFLTGTLA